MFPGPRQFQEKDSTSPPVGNLKGFNIPTSGNLKTSRIILKPCKWESIGTDVVLPVLYPNCYLTNGRKALVAWTWGKKMVLLSFSSHFFMRGNGFWFQESSNQISFSNKAILFCDVVETCQFLVSCWRIKELSDMSPKSVIQSPWKSSRELLLGSGRLCMETEIRADLIAMSEPRQAA